MRFATIVWDGREQGAVQAEKGWVPLSALDGSLAGDLLVLIQMQLAPDRLEDLRARACQAPNRFVVGKQRVRFRPPYRHPRLIWGIGLNYADHASDLHEEAPADPATFIKGDHTIVGHLDEIVLPAASGRVTGEAEVGVIFGRYARNIEESHAFDVVFGFCPVLDQTAEDILQQNPRFLTRSKNFETFFSFGPEVVTADELPELSGLGISTVLNGEVKRQNTVRNMMNSPSRLIAFHTAMMPLLPGDIIATGTPGAAVLRPGDEVEARIDAFMPLKNRVASAPPAW